MERACTSECAQSPKSLSVFFPLLYTTKWVDKGSQKPEKQNKQKKKSLYFHLSALNSLCQMVHMSIDCWPNLLTKTSCSSPHSALPRQLLQSPRPKTLARCHCHDQHPCFWKFVNFFLVVLRWVSSPHVDSTSAMYAQCYLIMSFKWSLSMIIV